MREKKIYIYQPDVKAAPFLNGLEEKRSIIKSLKKWLLKSLQTLRA